MRKVYYNYYVILYCVVIISFSARDESHAFLLFLFFLTIIKTNIQKMNKVYSKDRQFTGIEYFKSFYRNYHLDK